MLDQSHRIKSSRKDKESQVERQLTGISDSKASCMFPKLTSRIIVVRFGGVKRSIKKLTLKER